MDWLDANYDENNDETAIFKAHLGKQSMKCLGLSYTCHSRHIGWQRQLPYNINGLCDSPFYK